MGVFKKYYLDVIFKHYCNISGRAARKEYCFYVLFWGIIWFAVGWLSIFIGIKFNIPSLLPTGNNPFSAPLVSVYCFFTLLPFFSLVIRRLHDLDASWLWALCLLIPGISLFFLLGFAVLSGTPTNNKYGPNVSEYTQQCHFSKTNKMYLSAFLICVISAGLGSFFYRDAERNYPKYTEEEWKQAGIYALGSEIIKFAHERGLIASINGNESDRKIVEKLDVSDNWLFEAVFFLKYQSGNGFHHAYPGNYPALYRLLRDHPEITPGQFRAILLDALKTIPAMSPPKVTYVEMEWQQRERIRAQKNIPGFFFCAALALSSLSAVIIQWGLITGIIKKFFIYISPREIFTLFWKNTLAVSMLGIATYESGTHNLDLEEGYYTLLRIVIFLLSLQGAFRWFKAGLPVLYFALIGTAIFFNPIIQIHFDRDIWFVIDLIAIVIFCLEGFFRFKIKA